MGNCMKNSKAVIVHDEQKLKPHVEEAHKIKDLQSIKRKKTVRFRVDDEKAEEGQEMKKKGVVRIRLVVTQEELKQILNGQLNCSSTDEFLRKIKLESRSRRTRRNKRRLYQDGSGSNGQMLSSTSWRPALESISEDH